MAGPALEVEWSGAAEADLDGIIGRIALDRPVAAVRTLSRLRSLAESLARSPGRGRIVPEPRALGLSAYREPVLAPWRMVYRIAGRRVFIVLLLDARRDAEDVLLDRLIRRP